MASVYTDLTPAQFHHIFIENVAPTVPYKRWDTMVRELIAAVSIENKGEWFEQLLYLAFTDEIARRRDPKTTLHLSGYFADRLMEVLDLDNDQHTVLYTLLSLLESLVETFTDETLKQGAAEGQVAVNQKTVDDLGWAPLRLARDLADCLLDVYDWNQKTGGARGVIVLHVLINGIMGLYALDVFEPTPDKGLDGRFPANHFRQMALDLCQEFIDITP